MLPYLLLWDKANITTKEKTEEEKPQKTEQKVKAIFDSTKSKTHGAHGIGCRN